MNLVSFLKVWFISYIGFFILDMFTHVVLLGSLMTSELGGVIRASSEIPMPVVLLQTLIISLGTVFIIWKTQPQSRTWQQTAAVGAVLGLLIYGIHELASYSSLPVWSMNFVVAHTIAGMIQMAVVAVWIRFVMGRFGKKDTLL